ncbi:two-component system sensor histidine kinase MprB [Ilumatobacter fluminis]|uniref:histidine kinase n=1 Tax=Ilumatobacter fluminis TaxID=467091 RepID=A0A4V3EIH8_9ACTN|nr:HAMP domain-containing sensor histidine kinase [Ilumatobacter fluminis]TDT14558.1 two-component system sensor histidine kinase MprB [Ilumatobacter fluminis]
MSLRGRVTAIVAVLVVVGIGAVAVIAYGVTRNELTSEVDQFVKERAQEIVEGQRESRDRRDRNDGNGRADGDVVGEVDLELDRDGVTYTDADAIVQAIDGDGVVIESDGGDLPVDSVDIAVASGDRAVLRDIEIDGESYRMITVPYGDSGAIQVARSTASTDSVLSALGWRFALVGALFAALAALAGWLLMRRATRPLADLTAATERVARTHDLEPLHLDRDDEIGRLADSFDEMLLALSSSREQQRRLVQDAGHELRTPLTSLRANIEYMERAPALSDDQRGELLAALRTETEELGVLVNEVIALASGDVGDADPDTELDLADVVAGAVERFRRRTEHEVELSLEPTPLVGNEALLDRAVTNLLGNAHKFGPADRPIEVCLADRTLTVRDHGPGIDPSDLDRVFDRFYRSDAARSQPGSGLGLAIVRQVAERHGATARATNADADGTVVTLTFP